MKEDLILEPIFSPNGLPARLYRAERKTQAPVKGGSRTKAKGKNGPFNTNRPEKGLRDGKWRFLLSSREVGLNLLTRGDRNFEGFDLDTREFNQMTYPGGCFLFIAQQVCEGRSAEQVIDHNLHAAPE